MNTSTQQATGAIMNDEVRATLSKLFSARSEAFLAIEKLEQLGALNADCASEILATIDVMNPDWQGQEVSEQQASKFLTAINS